MDDLAMTYPHLRSNYRNMGCIRRDIEEGLGIRNRALRTMCYRSVDLSILTVNSLGVTIP